MDVGGEDVDARERKPLRLSFDLDQRSGAVRAAQAGLSEEEIRTARRVLSSGQTASDPRIARLVVALAEQQRDGDVRLVAAWLGVFALVIWTMARLAIDPLDATSAAVAAMAGAAGFAMTMRTRRVLREVRAERENQQLLDTFRLEPIQAVSQHQSVGPLRAIWKTVPALVLGVAVTAGLDTISGHHHVSVASVATRALLFSGLMAIVVLGCAWYRAQSNR
jgi:hypothetical protein